MIGTTAGSCGEYERERPRHGRARQRRESSRKQLAVVIACQVVSGGVPPVHEGSRLGRGHQLAAVCRARDAVASLRGHGGRCVGHSFVSLEVQAVGSVGAAGNGFVHREVHWEVPLVGARHTTLQMLGFDQGAVVELDDLVLLVVMCGFR